MRTDAATFQMLENALQAAQLRQQVYANNIANIDTPGYKRQDVQFETLLQNAMSATPQAVLGVQRIPLAGANLDLSAAVDIQPNIVQDTSVQVDNNGNNVDVDAEMAKLAENQIHYSALTEDIKLRLDRMKSAIDGGA